MLLAQDSTTLYQTHTHTAVRVAKSNEQLMSMLLLLLISCLLIVTNLLIIHEIVAKLNKFMNKIMSVWYLNVTLAVV
jgi:hypothetical protein